LCSSKSPAVVPHYLPVLDVAAETLSMPLLDTGMIELERDTITDGQVCGILEN
jgi:hypothetical protein